MCIFLYLTYSRFFYFFVYYIYKIYKNINKKHIEIKLKLNNKLCKNT
jgi:hypothetical protein